MLREKPGGNEAEPGSSNLLQQSLRIDFLRRDVCRGKMGKGRNGKTDRVFLRRLAVAAICLLGWGCGYPVESSERKVGPGRRTGAEKPSILRIRVPSGSRDPLQEDTVEPDEAEFL